MLIRRRRGWELPESQATPEAVFHDRRRFAKLLAVGPILLPCATLLAACDEAPANESAGQSGGPTATQLAAAEVDPSASLYPVERNLRYRLDREITDEKLVTTYNNYYEFGSSKNIWQAAQKMALRPWRVQFSGLIEQPFEIDIDDLLKRMPLEERLYRHRCVEAWSIAVPWSGFPMRALVELAKPLASAKYVKMTTLQDADVMPGQRAGWYPWPYVEGLTMAEATNDLAFIGTGAYGKPMPKQNGAPLRLVVPWKYGFKSVKSIVSFEFTDERPLNFWQEIQDAEYGFWANVNPKVPHPRWSQARERVLGADREVPTQIYNGYGEFVADLYSGLEGEKLFM
jgi:sulfoxide reductase catalytic subunit YedY